MDLLPKNGLNACDENHLRQFLKFVFFFAGVEKQGNESLEFDLFMTMIFGLLVDWFVLIVGVST